MLTYQKYYDTYNVYFLSIVGQVHEGSGSRGMEACGQWPGKMVAS